MGRNPEHAPKSDPMALDPKIREFFERQRKAMNEISMPSDEAVERGRKELLDAVTKKRRGFLGIFGKKL